MRYIAIFTAFFCFALPLFAQDTKLAISGALAFEAKSLASLDAQTTSRLLSSRPAQTASAPDVQFDRTWLNAQPYVEGGAEWHCLSEALYFEARGETVKGQFAVAEVILNRVASSDFPDTICAVINQGTGKRYQCQFTYTCDGYAEVIAEPRAWEMVGKVARLAMDGAAGDLTDGAEYYHTKAVRPRWSRIFEHTATIGVHRFYRGS